MGESPMPRAFTLVEVTISVAIAVVLMLGIAQVFRIVGDTVGTGEALATAQRDARATQAVMAHDFNTTVSDGAPFMLLSSQQQWAFRNAADLAGDKDGNPASYDPQNTGTETLQAATNYNYRSHRIDCLTFFGRGSFARQTGADASSGGISPFVSTMGGLEAMLWYGHLNLADNAGSFTVNGNLSNNSPGAGTTTLAQSNSYNTVNPNNFFATQWILGRQQIILQPPSPLYNNDTVLNPPAVIDQTNTSTDAGNIQYAYMPNSVNLSPLAYNSLAFVSNGTLTQLAGATVLSSRLDLAATSILGFRNSVQSYINSANNNSTPWWNILPGGYDSKNTRNVWRFQAQPFFLPAAGAAKVTAASMAYQSPIFVRGCTSFTVEYAGDYLNQSAPAAYVTQANQGITDTLYHYDSSTNTTTATGTTDGQIDFTYVVPVNAAPLTNTQNLVRQIRWYGLPRSTTNNTTISAGIGTGNGDVTPLRDVLTALNSVPADASALTYSGVTAAQIPTQAPFEVQLPTLNNNSTAASSDYAGLSSTPPGSAPTAMLQQPAAGASGSQYVCAWGPNDPKPKMIRITMTIDDPGGRLGEGQTYEYIYTLP
jgi:type II secretory pathway pseudopilin PulG